MDCESWNCVSIFSLAGHGRNCHEKFGLSFLEYERELEETLNLPGLESIALGASVILKITTKRHKNSSWNRDPVGDA